MTVPVSRTSTALRTPLAVDAGATTVLDAEHLLHTLEGVLGPTSRATTHFAGGRVVVVGEWPVTGVLPLAEQLAAVGSRDAAVVIGADAVGPEEQVDSAVTALERHADRSSGRLVRYVGREAVERETTVGDVLRLSEVDAVVALGGVDLPASTPLDLREWARPELRSGRAVLTVQETSAGLVPFESREQQPCCSSH